MLHLEDVGEITHIDLVRKWGPTWWFPKEISLTDNYEYSMYKFNLNEKIKGNSFVSKLARTKKLVTFYLTTKTGKGPDEDTSGTISMRIEGGGHIRNIFIGQETQKAKFRPGQKAVFKVWIQDIAEVIKIYVTLYNGRGRRDPWFSDWIKVKDARRGRIYRFNTKRWIFPFQENVMFDNPWREDRGVAMCLYHRYTPMRHEMKATTKPMALDASQNYPCSHMVYRHSQVNKADKNQLKLMRSKYKILKSVKIVAWDFDIKQFSTNVSAKLRQNQFHGLEIHCGHIGYGRIANKDKLSQLLRNLHYSFHVDTKDQQRLELSIVVLPNRNSTSLYNVQELTKYADYVVINAMVDEWNGRSFFDISTLSPSPLMIANRGGESQNDSVTAWLQGGLRSDQVILPFATFAWNPIMCFDDRKPIDVKSCMEFYDSSFIKIRAGKYVSKVPFFELCYGRSGPRMKEYMNTSLYHDMQRGPNVPFETQATVLQRVNYIMKHQLRGTIVTPLQYDGHQGFCPQGRFPLSTVAYKELVDPNFRFSSGQHSEASSTSAATQAKLLLGGPAKGTSTLLMIAGTAIQLFAGQ